MNDVSCNGGTEVVITGDVIKMDVVWVMVHKNILSIVLMSELYR